MQSFPLGVKPAGRQLTATSIATTNRPLKSVRHSEAEPDELLSQRLRRLNICEAAGNELAIGLS